MSNELAAYIADYINEEIERQTSKPLWTASTEVILEAVDAYEGGAR